MHALLYDTSSLFKIFLPHPNTLKALKQFGISYVTSLFASFCFVIVNYDLYSSVEHNSSSSVEQLWDKVLLTMMPFDSSSSVEQLYDKVLCTMMPFDSSLSVEQTCEDEAVVSVLTG